MVAYEGERATGRDLGFRASYWIRRYRSIPVVKRVVLHDGRWWRRSSYCLGVVEKSTVADHRKGKGHSWHGRRLDRGWQAGQMQRLTNKEGGEAEVEGELGKRGPIDAAEWRY
jgi:hypothetical protein